MSWEVEYTDEFGEWWDKLSEREQDNVTAIVELLMEQGPRLPFPYSSGIEGSRILTCANFACSLAGDRCGSCTLLIPGGWQYS